MSIVSQKLKKEFFKNDEIRDKGLTTPEDVVRYDDIFYGEDHKWQILDVYRPKDSEGILPVIVSVHGGGWVYGDKERYQWYCMDLARRGFAVVNFTYRLAPEYKFPSPIEDTNSVIKWILANSDEYGLDKNHVFAVGDSAGAHCLCLYTCIITDPDYALNYSFKVPEDFSFKAIGLNCGAYEIKIERKLSLTGMLMRDYLPGKGSKEEIELINCLNHINRNFPPVFVMTATGDFLKDQAMLIERILAEKNVEYVYRIYESEDKELGHVFHCDIRSKDARICNDEECDFFKKYL